MNDGLRGRSAIVTGASSGIGEAIVRRLVEGGATVVMNARRADRLAALEQELGTEDVAAVPGDAADPAVVERLFEAGRERFAQPADLVVVNAGRGLRGSLHDSDESQWEEMIRTNLLGAARLMREAARRLLDLVPQGSDAWLDRRRDIVVLGSNVGKHISPFSSMYGSTKFAVGALAEALRRELGPRGVRVTLIAPGIVRSEFQRVAGYDPVGFGEFMDRVGPVLEPEDIADLVAHVAAQPARIHLNDITIRPTRQDYP